MRITLQPLEVRSPDDFEHVFDRISAERADAMMALLDLCSRQACELWQISRPRVACPRFRERENSQTQVVS